VYINNTSKEKTTASGYFGLDFVFVSVFFLLFDKVAEPLKLKFLHNLYLSSL